MKHLERLGTEFSINIPTDETGMLGRECPVDECEGYFKIQPGTGLTGKDLPCHCAYCGHTAGQDQFYTKAQIEYAQSVVIHEVTGAILKDFKELEFEHKPQGLFGIGISMKVEGRPQPIRYYRERELETEVICDHCTLRYMIYGVFGYCPDCGVHNSLQILTKNFEIVEKLLSFAESQEPPVAEVLVANALEDCVSAFDGFGRETCETFSNKSSDPSKANNVSFQNVERAQQRIMALFCIDLAQAITPEQWSAVKTSFQKRHLLAHKMGVVDQAYLDATSDPSAVIGRKVQITPAEISDLLIALKAIGKDLFDSLSG